MAILTNDPARFGPVAGKRVLGTLAGRLRVPADLDLPLPDDVLADFEGRDR